MKTYEAFSHELSTTGMATVIVACTDDGGWLEAGVFLLDLLCLGVKDAFVTEMPARDWPPHLDKMIDPKVRQTLHPACARKLVEGAVTYAESLGFVPHRDYKKARRIFGSVSARDCPESFTYGHEGKPLFVAGPDDDQARIDRIMRTLTAKVGPEGFHFMVPGDLGDEDDEPEESDQDTGEKLRELFAHWNRATDFHVASGMIAASCVCPGEIEFEDLVSSLWDHNPPSPWTGNDVERLSSLLVDYWNETADRFDFAEDARKPEAVPHFVDEPWKDDDELRDRATAWCRGFMRVVRAFPNAWQGAPDNPRTGVYLNILDEIARRGRATLFFVPMRARSLPHRIGFAVLSLRRALPAVEDDKPAESD